MAARKRMFGDEKPDWDAIRRRIEAAVERGDLTREEADAKYREIREQMAREDDRAAEYRASEARIRAAVEAGEISREDAERRLVETRMHMFGGERSSDASDDVR